MEASDEETCSVASSTSYWVLEDTNPPKEETIITLNQDQYECLVELLEDPKYSGNHWTLTQSLPSWTDLLTSKKQRIPLPLYYNWLGILKIGLVAHQCPDVEELYSALAEAVLPSMKCGKHSLRQRCLLVSPRLAKDKIDSPYSFIGLCHLGQGAFHVEYSKIPGNMSKFTKKKVGALRNEAGNRKNNFSQHINNLVTNETRYSHYKLPALSHGVRLAQYTSAAQKKLLYDSLKGAMCGGSEIESIEGVHSEDFYSLMELSFAQLYTQLAGAGEDVDLETVQKWSSVEEFIKNSGTEIMKGFNNETHMMPIQ